MRRRRPLSSCFACCAAAPPTRLPRSCGCCCALLPAAALPARLPRSCGCCCPLRCWRCCRPLLPAAALLPQQLPAANALRCCWRCCAARCCRRRAHAGSRRRRRRKTQLAEKIFNISILIFSTFYVSNFNILSSQLQHFESQMLKMFSKMLS